MCFPVGRDFRDNLRTYNNIFSFCSLGLRLMNRSGDLRKYIRSASKAFSPTELALYSRWKESNPNLLRYTLQTRIQIGTYIIDFSALTGMLKKESFEISRQWCISIILITPYTKLPRKGWARMSTFSLI
jgi:hypothetical protein